jgi:hypothetical protein
MKTLLIAAALVATSFAASADHKDYSRQAADSGPGKTRAEVIADLQVAKAAGLIQISESEMRQAERRSRMQSTSSLTRQQVKQEVVALLEKGELEVHGGN